MTPQQIDAMKLALDALKLNNKEWKSLADSGDAGYWKAEDQDHYKQTEEAITALEEALAEHAMRETQRLGQEIEQEPVAHWSDCAVHSEPAYPKSECDCGGIVAVADYTALSDKYVALSDKYVALKAQHKEQEPVAWMDADGNVSDNNDHKCFPIPLYTKEQP